MSEKYTPGPWRIAGTATGYITNTGKGGRVQVAVVGAYDDKKLLPFNKERWDADASLIAAAPDLYEAHEPHSNPPGPDFLDWLAERLVKVYGENHETDLVQALRRKAAKARAALSKAATP